MKLEVVYTCHTYFNIPEDVNLQDREQVEKWYIDDDNCLVIIYKNGFEDIVEGSTDNEEILRFTIIDELGLPIETIYC
jgi:hypothetical protein